MGGAPLDFSWTLPHLPIETLLVVRRGHGLGGPIGDRMTGKELGGTEPRALDVGVPKDCELVRFRTRQEKMRFTGACCDAQENVALRAKTLLMSMCDLSLFSPLPTPTLPLGSELGYFTLLLKGTKGSGKNI